MQYWEGDREQAMDTAKLIVDLQPKDQKRHSFLFAYRFDAKPPDPEVLAYVATKFDVVKPHKGRRTEIGWPAGCNAMACDVLMLAAEKSRRKEWKTDAVWLLESDIVPLKKEWLSLIDAEWQRARLEGKLVMGAWQPEWAPNGHINGNLIFHPSLCLEVQGIHGSPPQIGWDVFLAETFRPHWWKCSQMVNYYHAKDVKESDLFPEGEPFCFVHGIKDSSGRDVVRKRIQDQKA